MKTNPLKLAASIGLTALLVGSAAAQESFSKPVGYETLNYFTGFNYLGLRLHEPVVTSGVVVGVDAAVATVADGVADALTAGTTYLLEVVGGDAQGAVVTIESFDAAADTITLSEDISDNFDVGGTFIIRPSATIASVFGEMNDVANSGAGLASTSSFSTSDQVWLPDGLGGFVKYAFVQGNPFLGTQAGWQTSAGVIIDPSEVLLVFTDGIIVNATATGSLVVSGAVKLEGASIALTSTFNFAGSIFPAGLTLDESDLQLSLSSTSSFGTSDQVWLPNGGGFDKYAWVQGNPFLGTPAGWQNSAGAAIDGSAVSFDGASGIVLVRSGTVDKMVTVSAPEFYSAL